MLLNHENHLEQLITVDNVEIQYALANVVSTGGQIQGGRKNGQSNKGGNFNFNGHHGGHRGKNGGCRKIPLAKSVEKWVT